MGARERGLSLHSSRGKRSSGNGSGGSQRVKTRRGMGAMCPAALPTQKVTLGTLLEVREALWGDRGCGSPHWLQRVKLYG